jgi:hypothetical protein
MEGSCSSEVLVSHVEQFLNSFVVMIVHHLKYQTFPSWSTQNPRGSLEGTIIVMFRSVHFLLYASNLSIDLGIPITITKPIMVTTSAASIISTFVTVILFILP